MKIAITYENGQVFQHFGHTPAFMVYTVEAGKVLDSVLVETGESGHGALAGVLAQHDIQALICGGIGGGARMALAQCGIAVYGGVAGDADEAAQAFADGALLFDPNARCSHHDDHHGADHVCGSHGCGSHSCH